MTDNNKQQKAATPDASLLKGKDADQLRERAKAAAAPYTHKLQMAAAGLHRDMQFVQEGGVPTDAEFRDRGLTDKQIQEIRKGMSDRLKEEIKEVDEARKPVMQAVTHAFEESGFSTTAPADDSNNKVVKSNISAVNSVVSKIEYPDAAEAREKGYGNDVPVDQPIEIPLPFSNMPLGPRQPRGKGK